VVDTPLEPQPQAQLLDRHAPLEQQCKNNRIERLQQIGWAPTLFREQAQHTVTDILIHALDIGVGVVTVIVRGAPVFAGANNIPLERLAVEARIAHPVILAMYHVMAELHIVENLGDAKQEGSKDQRRRKHAKKQQATTSQFQVTYCRINATDIT